MKAENAGVLGLIIGAAGLVWAGYVAIKCNKIADKVGMSVDDIAKSSNIQIQDSMVNQAVQTAVDRTARDLVEKASQSAVKAVTNDIHSQVSKVVEEAYSDVKEAVKTRLEGQIGDINIDRVRREIVNEGKEKAARIFGESLNEIRDSAKSKFEDELNGILNRHNNELDSVSKIYSSIADAMSSRGSVIKL